MRSTNTNKTGSDSRDHEVAAVILIENTLTGRLPTRYENLTVDEQRQIAEAAAQHYGLNPGRLITLWDTPRWDRGSRLINMLDCLKNLPAHVLIVPGPLYRGFTKTAIRKHRRVLERHGTTLLIAEQ